MQEKSKLTLEDAMIIILKRQGPTHYAELTLLIGKMGLWLRPKDGQYPKKEQVHVRASRDSRFDIKYKGIVYLK